MSKVSIIIPTRNRSNMLLSAINSVMLQSYQNYEILVVDDCSTDDTRKVVQAMQNGKIKYISHDFQKGEAGSRNTGIKNATGEFIAFLDDDDEWLPDKLKLQLELFEKREKYIGAVYTGYWFVNIKNNEILFQNIPEKKGFIYNELLLDNVIGTPSTVLLRKQVIQEIGLFDESLPYYVDYDLFIRISKYYQFEYIKTPLVKYHVHDNMLSRNPHILLKGIEKFRRKYSKKRGGNLSNIFIGKAYLKIGNILCNNNHLQLGRKAFCKSIQHNPYQYRTYYYLFSSMLGNEYFHKMKFIKKYIRSLVKEE
jgi:glycosyltransferase involved in cell wall biosynthesis